MPDLLERVNNMEEKIDLLVKYLMPEPSIRKEDNPKISPEEKTHIKKIVNKFFYER